MRPRLSLAEMILLPVLVAAGGGAVWFAFYEVGFLGLGILGLIVGLGASSLELQGGRPIGSGRVPGLYADAVGAEERMTRAERAERRADIARARLPLHIARIVSAGLIILGFGLFFVFQLPA